MRDGGMDRKELLKLRPTSTVPSIAILTRAVWKGGPSDIRRYAGMVLDNVGITYFMATMGEDGVMMFGLYLFITFGNGFRYGPKYLHICQLMALAGVSAVMFIDDHWSSNRMIGWACLLSIVVLPFYVSMLAKGIRVAKKRADEANQAKGRFLANMSHEMRTPLNGVIAMADVLRETNLSESQREIATPYTSANVRLAQIEDADMAKIEAGRIQIESRPLDRANSSPAP
jgi:two-component system sensor histidine kinase RpfC